ncbi:uncharacterized protein LOC135845389 [Planococcus citri]|uniref:uncharacterized protein LOC135845389 n=1 Tax=Planococcus citri TaxID=170843 RepID=UPI0031FA3D0B
MRRKTFWWCILIQIILFKKWRGFCQQLQSEIRIIKAGNCNMSGLTWTMRDISIQSQYPRTYMNLRFDVSKEIKTMKKVYYHFERCNEQGFDCEDFQNFSVDRFCSLMLMKNQIWSGFIDRCQPPLRCPLKKMSYEVQNATVDIDDLTRFYPDVLKYNWYANIEVSDERDAIVFCGFFKIHVFQYRKRDRKHPKSS